MKKFIQVLLLSLKHNRSLSNSSSSRWLLIPFNRTYFQGAGQGGAISPGGEGAELCFPARITDCPVHNRYSVHVWRLS